MAVTKKISRKDINKMSTRDFFRAAQEPYRKLLSYLKPYKLRFGLGILFGALYGLANGLMVFSVQFVGTAVFPSEGAAERPPRFPVLMNFINEHIPLPDAQSGFGVFLACMTVPTIMLLRGLFSYLNSYCMMWVSMRVLDDIRTKLFERMMAQSLSFFNQSKTGELIQTVFNQTRMAQMALTTVSSDIIKQPISILAAFGALLVVDWKFTLIALLLFPLCIVPVIVIGRRIRKAGEKEEAEAGMLMVVMQEAFAGIRVVKTHAQEGYESKRFNLANEKMLKMIMRWRKAMELVGPVVEAVASLGVAGALLYAWYFGLGVGEFMALQGGLIMLYPPAKSLSRVHLLMQKCLAATTKVFALMEQEPDIQDSPDAKDLKVSRGAIDLKDVTFGYRKNTPAVRDLNLTIPAGTTCALVGVSGAGKSTVLSLVQRLYEADKGSIIVDGHDIRKITQNSLRRNIGTVSQDTFLFHDTILNNIRYGKLDATVDEVKAAAKQAFAHDFIIKTPRGYDSIVGDKGCLLSGGQQQRISIARALLKNAPILLLDEATSALDSEAEKQIQAALERLAEGRTVIAIAHRLSTILKSDQIVVMQDGEIMEVGSHAELFAHSGHYRRLYDLQFHSHEQMKSLQEVEPVPVQDQADF